MKAKYLVLMSIFYLQTTMSDHYKKKPGRRYFSALRTSFHGYRRQGPQDPGPPPPNSGKKPPNSPRGVGGPEDSEKRRDPKAHGPPPGYKPKDNQPSDVSQSGNMETTLPEPSTVWGPMPAYRENLTEQCDYLAHYCMKSYNTGEVCGRTILYSYYTFKNYCMLDYVNCMRQFEAWMLLHMGPCYNITFPSDYVPPDRGGAGLEGELVKNNVLDRVVALQVFKRTTDDY